jgi:chromosomal replication initiation ATPase DnaA
MKPKKVTYLVPNYYSEELQLMLLKSSEEIISDYLSKLPDVQKIIHVICEHFGFPLSTILVKIRKEEVVYKRQMLFYFLKHYTILCDKDIGRISIPMFSSSDVCHSATVIKEMSYLKEVKEDIEAIRAKISL